MRPIFLLLFLLLNIYISKAQYSGVSLEMHYPIVVSVAETNYSTEVDGVIGGSFNFQFTDNLQYNFGASYQFDVFQYNLLQSEYSKPTKSGFVMNHIDLYSKLMFIDLPELQLIILGGFTTFKYKKSANDRSYNGFNAGAGFSYDVSEQLHIITNYSYIQATKKYNDGTRPTPEGFHLARIGLGFNF